MSTRRVLVYGGKGALGTACVNYFKTKNWWVTNIDMKENSEANANIVINSSNNLLEQESAILNEVNKFLDQQKFDAIICVAGGWAGGNSSSKDFIKNTDLMIKQSVWSSVLAAKLASKYLNEGGLLTFTGAKAALDGTPGMIGYGLAKASVHHLTKSLCEEKSGLPKNANVYSLLPVTLDTEMNRKWMPNSDFSSWTPLNYIAELLFNWSININRPKNGALVQLITKDNKTELLFS